MGTEFEGVSDRMMTEVDDYVEIPMFGFSESFNISVASAIVMNKICTRVREAEIDSGLSDEEKQYLRLQWAFRTVKSADLILEREGLQMPIEK